MRIWSISSKNVDLTNKTGVQPAKDWGWATFHRTISVITNFNPDFLELNGPWLPYLYKHRGAKAIFPLQPTRSPAPLCELLTDPMNHHNYLTHLAAILLFTVVVLAKVGQLWQMLLHKYAGRCWQSQLKSALFRSKTNGPASLISAQQVHWVCPRTVQCSWGKRMNIPAEPR